MITRFLVIYIIYVISFYGFIIALLCDKIVINPLTIIEKEAVPPEIPFCIRRRPCPCLYYNFTGL